MAAHCSPRLPDGPGGLRAARDRGGDEVRKVLVLGHQLVDGEDLRLRLSELRPGLFIERAEIPDRLPLRALETRQLLLRRPGLRLRRGGGRQHDDLANGKALRDGYALQLLHGPT